MGLGALLLSRLLLEVSTLTSSLCVLGILTVAHVARVVVELVVADGLARIREWLGQHPDLAILAAHAWEGPDEGTLWG